MLSMPKLCSTMLRRLTDATFVLKKQRLKQLWFYEVQAFSTLPSTAGHHFTDIFSSENESKVLKIINEMSAAELNKYNIASTYAEKLVLYRDQRGPYKSLQDLVQVDGMDNSAVKSIYESIVKHKDNERTLSKKKLNRLVKIPCATHAIKSTDTILGIHLGNDTITWALLNPQYQLLDWNCDKIEQHLAGTEIFDSIIHIFNIFRHIPASSHYVMEQSIVGDRIRYKSDSLVLTRPQLLAITMTYLAIKNGQSQHSQGNLFLISNRSIARYFRLLIGNEIVSSQSTIKSWCKGVPYNHELSGELLINIEDKFKDVYLQRSESVREQMNWALLNAAAFVHVNDYQNNVEKE